MLFNASVDIERAPLYSVVLRIAALWVLANVGYYMIFPTLGLSISYNEAPFAIAAYFLFWALVSGIYFHPLVRDWRDAWVHLWTYVVYSFAIGVVLSIMLLILARLPGLVGPELAPYTDILLVTPWYLLPKAAEVLVQQILIAVLIISLRQQLGGFQQVLIGYLVIFGGVHVVQFALSAAPLAYAGITTIAALLSTTLFPYLILHMRGGFVIAYVVHLLFYVLFAIMVHAWPPPGYFLS